MTLRMTFLGAATLAALAGCGDPPPEIATLEGKVTLAGKPIEAGIVGICSEDGVTLTSAEIRPDGSYSVIGAPVGPVRVRVVTSTFRTLEPEPGSNQATPRPNPRFVEIPKRYESFDSSGLTTSVALNGTKFDIAIAR